MLLPLILQFINTIELSIDENIKILKVGHHYIGGLSFDTLHEIISPEINEYLYEKEKKLLNVFNENDCDLNKIVVDSRNQLLLKIDNLYSSDLKRKSYNVSEVSFFSVFTNFRHDGKRIESDFNLSRNNEMQNKDNPNLTYNVGFNGTLSSLIGIKFVGLSFAKIDFDYDCESTFKLGVRAHENAENLYVFKTQMLSQIENLTLNILKLQLFIHMSLNVNLKFKKIIFNSPKDISFSNEYKIKAKQSGTHSTYDQIYSPFKYEIDPFTEYSFDPQGNFNSDQNFCLSVSFEMFIKLSFHFLNEMTSSFNIGFKNSVKYDFAFSNPKESYFGNQRIKIKSFSNSEGLYFDGYQQIKEFDNKKKIDLVSRPKSCLFPRKVKCYQQSKNYLLINLIKQIDDDFLLKIYFKDNSGNETLFKKIDDNDFNVFTKNAFFITKYYSNMTLTFETKNQKIEINPSEFINVPSKDYIDFQIKLKIINKAENSKVNCMFEQPPAFFQPYDVYSKYTIGILDNNGYFVKQAGAGFINNNYYKTDIFTNIPSCHVSVLSIYKKAKCNHIVFYSYTEKNNDDFTSKEICRIDLSNFEIGKIEPNEVKHEFIWNIEEEKTILKIEVGDNEKSEIYEIDLNTKNPSVDCQYFKISLNLDFEYNPILLHYFRTNFIVCRLFEKSIRKHNELIKINLLPDEKFAMLSLNLSENITGSPIFCIFEAENINLLCEHKMIKDNTFLITSNKKQIDIPFQSEKRGKVQIRFKILKVFSSHNPTGVCDQSNTIEGLIKPFGCFYPITSSKKFFSYYSLLGQNKIKLPLYVMSNAYFLAFNDEGSLNHNYIMRDDFEFPKYSNSFVIPESIITPYSKMKLPITIHCDNCLFINAKYGNTSIKIADKENFDFKPTEGIKTQFDGWCNSSKCKYRYFNHTFDTGYSLIEYENSNGIDDFSNDNSVKLYNSINYQIIPNKPKSTYCKSWDGEIKILTSELINENLIINVKIYFNLNVKIFITYGNWKIPFNINYYASNPYEFFSNIGIKNVDGKYTRKIALFKPSGKVLTKYKYFQQSLVRFDKVPDFTGIPNYKIISSKIRYYVSEKLIILVSSISLSIVIIVILIILVIRHKKNNKSESSQMIYF